MKNEMKKTIRNVIIGSCCLLLLTFFIGIFSRPSWGVEINKNDLSFNITILDNMGGRIGISNNDTIVFDSKGADDYYDLYTMQMDGSERKSLTSQTEGVSQKHNGNPVWHPNGNHIVFQSVDPNLQGLPPRYADIEMALTGPGAGINNNLWITNKKGDQFWQLTKVEDKNGVLHPHFSHDGTKLLWSELIDHTKSPSGYYVRMDIYEYNLDTEKLVQITGPDYEWDEHAHYSPDGKNIVWMSSKNIPQIIKQYKVKTDYWIMDRNGDNKQRLTYFNDPQHQDFISGGAVAGDFDWVSDGSQGIGYLIITEAKLYKNILIEFCE